MSKNSIVIGKWIKISLIYLVLIGFLGAFLRWQFVSPIKGVNYKYFLHAHSHVAFLGWVFNALFALVIFQFLPLTKKLSRHFKVLFWLFQIAVLGMLFTFPIQGYATFSIIFSTLHIFLSWWFTYKFLKESKREIISKSPAFLFIRGGFYLMILSTIGPFALGPIIANGLSGSHWYYLAIYFYLHFQYNGFFSFILFGLFFKMLENDKIKLNSLSLKRFYWIMLFTCLSGFALSALWTEPPLWVKIIGYLSAMAHFVVLYYLFLILKKSWQPLKKLWQGRIAGQLFFIVLIAFILKTGLQIISAYQPVAMLAYQVKNFTIGYLHLVFIGFVTIFILAFFNHLKFLHFSDLKAKIGLGIFFICFILSELYIIGQPGLFMLGSQGFPSYFLFLFIFSLFMPVGVLLLLFSQKQVKTIS
ncbi:hypothetical protein [Flexithrix dorotheae]|uniref:hypothetical protein n=1 Tax=Flexithrix dorotheae TaxID=70993 RepID=UPI00037DE179|nr:hypothetical protein [Flexithrix dorotheae]